MREDNDDSEESSSKKNYNEKLQKRKDKAAVTSLMLLFNLYNSIGHQLKTWYTDKDSFDALERAGYPGIVEAYPECIIKKILFNNIWVICENGHLNMLIDAKFEDKRMK